MRKIFLIAFIFLFAAQICSAAPPEINRIVANSQARQSFVLTSAEGDKYDVCIVGEDEKILADWIWAQGDEIFSGKYSAYLDKSDSATLKLQDVQLFANAHSAESPQRINVTQLDRDGFYRVKGMGGLPDFLVSKIQITGGGVFFVKIFVIKDGRLQQVNFLDAKKKLQDSRDTGFEPITCTGDGKISVPWWTNAAGSEGRYITTYTFDEDKLILRHVNTKKISSPHAN